MKQIVMGMGWATAMIGLALAANVGLVDREVFEMLIPAAPVLAVLAIAFARNSAARSEHQA